MPWDPVTDRVVQGVHGGAAYAEQKNFELTEYYQWEQLFRFVRPGAKRISATTSVSGTSVLGFRHPSTGQLAIVGRNDTGASQTLSISFAVIG